MSSRTVAMGFMSIGSLWMGALAEMTSTPLALALGAALYAVFTVALFTATPRLRRSQEWDPSVAGLAPDGPAGAG